MTNSVPVICRNSSICMNFVDRPGACQPWWVRHSIILWTQPPPTLPNPISSESRQELPRLRNAPLSSAAFGPKVKPSTSLHAGDQFIRVSFPWSVFCLGALRPRPTNVVVDNHTPRGPGIECVMQVKKPTCPPFPRHAVPNASPLGYFGAVYMPVWPVVLWPESLW